MKDQEHFCGYNYEHDFPDRRTGNKTERERLIEILLDGVTFTDEYKNTARMQAEYVADHLLANGVIVPPCKVGDTVYHIAKCGDFHRELDGTLYDSLGGLGDATGYYCPCELRNNCPFDNEEDFDCESQKSKLAIFEDDNSSPSILEISSLLLS